MNAPSRLVTFIPLGITERAKDNETLLDVARRAAVPLGNSCGATGICARCKVRVVTGADALTAPTAIEARVGAQRKFEADERMACQAVVTADCTVTTGYW